MKIMTKTHKKRFLKLVNVGMILLGIFCVGAWVFVGVCMYIFVCNVVVINVNGGIMNWMSDLTVSVFV